MKRGGAVATPRPDPPGVRRDDGAHLATMMLRVAVAVALAVGIALRAWLLFHRPINSDEATVGLMAGQIAHGHFSAFYWGQPYGGAEPYLVALRFLAFGTSASGLLSVPIGLSAVAGLLTWRIARRLVPDPTLAALAGALAWAAPWSAISNSAYEYGFRGVTLVCGLGLVLLALRLLDAEQRWPDYATLGVLTGVGWWSSPEIVYFVVPAALLVVGAIVQDSASGKWRRWAQRLALAAAAAVVGALPWLWANVRSHFSSLGSASVIVPAGSPDYGGRVAVFFRESVPMLYSLRASGSGAWLGGETVGLLLVVILSAVLGGSVVLCLLRGGRSIAIAVSALLFPFMMSVPGASYYWQDGRYAEYVVPLYALVLVVGVFEASRRLTGGRRQSSESPRALRRGLFSVVATGLVALCVANFAAFISPDASFFSSWGNPDAPVLRSISELEAHGIRDGYAHYWVSYKVDFLSDNRLHITTVGGPIRWESLNRQVLAHPDTAWLFVPPTLAAQHQFADTTAIRGPGALPEAQFIDELKALGVTYRVVNAGMIQAVVPNRTVRLSQVGLGAFG
jgi:hypothetical protein